MPGASDQLMSMMLRTSSPTYANVDGDATCRRPHHLEFIINRIQCQLSRSYRDS